MNSLLDSLLMPIFAVLLSLSITIAFAGYALSQFNHKLYNTVQQYTKDKHNAEQQQRELEQLYDLNMSSTY